MGVRVVAWSTSVVATAAIVAPFWSGVGGSGGYLLYRDAVSTPRSYVTDTALGLGDAPARAVPQDWTVALLSRVVDGSVVVLGLTTLALLLAGVGAGLLAGRVVPGARGPGAAAASVVAIWNPFTAERLLQGQWSLLLGAGCLGWIALAALDCRVRSRPDSWTRLASWCAVAAFTPTGGVFVAVMVGVVLIVPSVWRRRLRIALAGLVVLVLANLPWLVASALGGAAPTSDPAAVDVFAARAEPWLSTLGSVAGLGGIWNADAVPPSRTIGWTLVATLCLWAVALAGAPVLLRRRRRAPLIRELCVLAVLVTVAVALGASPPGRNALGWLVDTVPGAGLLRDTSKFVALAVPGFAVAAAAGVQFIGRWVPRGAAAALAAALVVLPLPDLAWGVGGRVHTVTYPNDWSAVARIVDASAGDVLTIPGGTNRRYEFTGGAVSLDPAARFLRASVVATGELLVGGAVVDAPTPDTRASLSHRAFAAGASPPTLARLGIGWILVENVGDPAARRSDTLTGLTPVYRGDLLTLYRIPGTTVMSASSVDRVLSWSTHIIWVAMILVGSLASRVVHKPHR